MEIEESYAHLPGPPRALCLIIPPRSCWRFFLVPDLLLHLEDRVHAGFQGLRHLAEEGALAQGSSVQLGICYSLRSFILRGSERRGPSLPGRSTYFLVRTGPSW